MTRPGASVHGIIQARILEWVAITFSRGSSQPRSGGNHVVFLELLRVFRLRSVLGGMGMEACFDTTLVLSVRLCAEMNQDFQLR